MKTLIKNLLREKLNDFIISCKNCGWNWKASESDKSDLYICHKCGYDNEPPYDDSNELNESNVEQKVAGVLIKCLENDKIFLLKRNDNTPKWALMSGGVDDGETPVATLKREMVEELGLDNDIINNITFKYDKTEHIPEKNRTFYYYEGFTMSPFNANLEKDENHENFDYGWFSKDEFPSPLYVGLSQKINRI
jgi:8-oxo-dGTP pyrophosphatase MutT (NUDIX family)